MCNYLSNLESVNQVPVTAGWTNAVWNSKFTRSFYTAFTLEIKPHDLVIPTAYTHLATSSSYHFNFGTLEQDDGYWIFVANNVIAYDKQKFERYCVNAQHE